MALLRHKKELWKPIADYVGKYEISNFGNVKSLDRYEKQLNNGVLCNRFRKGRLLKLNINKRDYVEVFLYKKGKSKHKLIHRLVAEEFIKNLEKDPQVNHKDGNKLNNNVKNLEWCTAKQNVKHAFKNGLKKSLSGENHNMSKLKENDVKKIRLALLDGVQGKKLAELFGVTKSTISLIKTGKRWSNINY